MTTLFMIYFKYIKIILGATLVRKLNTTHIPILLKLLLALWPATSILPFITVFFAGFFAKSSIGSRYLSGETITQIISIRRIGLKVFVTAVIIGFVYLIGSGSEVESVGNSIQLFAASSMILLYLSMLFFLFIKVKKVE